MRAVFTIDLQRIKDRFPEPEELMKVLDEFGLGFEDVLNITPNDIYAIVMTQGDSSAEDLQDQAEMGLKQPTQTDMVAKAGEPGTAQLIAHYKTLADILFAEMPEVAAAERKAVLYVGYLNSEQTPFLVTRMVPSQITFRLLHRELPRLKESTESIIRRLLVHLKLRHPFTMRNELIRVYERKFDHVVISGRVVTNALVETVRSNLKDTLLFIFPLAFFIYTLGLLVHSPSVTPQGFWHGTLERFNTALLTTALVSFLGLLQTYFQLRGKKLIDWK